jgi:mxaJ protein
MIVMNARKPILCAAQCAALAGLSLTLGFSVPAARADSQKPLRVCADPNYLPFSNRAGQGFENKVAELVAKAMGRKLEYHWASYRGHGGFSNFLATTLDSHKCDVVISLPSGDNEEAYTKPYYYSSYVFVTRKDKHYHIRSMNSVSLRKIKIGYEAGTTPKIAIMELNLIENAVQFHVSSSPNASPKEMLQAVQDGKVGVMITWEPAVGDFLKDYPDLQLARVPSQEYGPGLPAVNYSYGMSMGVRKHDTALKDELDKVIASHKTQLTALLATYNVRLYPGREDINQTH